MTAELALTKPDPTLDETSLRVMMAAAQRYVASGLLPAEVNTPQKALVVMTAGRELGVPATYALRNIHVVKGKPVCSAELLLALVRRTYGPAAMRVSKTSNLLCTVQYREQGWDGISEYTFTLEDAKQAGVANGNTWKAYPAAMLRARCISAVVRFAFPEAIAGLYTPEEMGADVTVNDDGSVEMSGGNDRPSLTVVDATATTVEDERARAVVPPEKPVQDVHECSGCEVIFADGETAHVRKKDGGEKMKITYAELNPVSVERFGNYFCDLCYDERRWPKVTPPDDQVAF